MKPTASLRGQDIRIAVFSHLGYASCLYITFKLNIMFPNFGIVLYSFSLLLRVTDLYHSNVCTVMKQQEAAS